jgi:hypothetical protein
MLIGQGYTQGVENDVLLLDISNNDEYIWTAFFDPVSSSPVSSSPVPSSSPSVEKNTNVPLVVGLSILSFILFISLVISIVYIRKIKFKFSSIRIPILRNRPTPQYNDRVNNFNFDNRIVQE